MEVVSWLSWGWRPLWFRVSCFFCLAMFLFVHWRQFESRVTWSRDWTTRHQIKRIAMGWTSVGLRKIGTCWTISELNPICNDSIAELTVACSYCVQSAILSPLIRNPYSRGRQQQQQQQTRTGRRLCQQRQLQGRQKRQRQPRQQPRTTVAKCASWRHVLASHWFLVDIEHVDSIQDDAIMTKKTFRNWPISQSHNQSLSVAPSSLRFTTPQLAAEHFRLLVLRCRTVCHRRLRRHRLWRPSALDSRRFCLLSRILTFDSSDILVPTHCLQWTYNNNNNNMRVGAERSGADTRTLSCARLYRGGVVYDGLRPRPQSEETSHSHEVYGRRRH